MSPKKGRKEKRKERKGGKSGERQTGSMPTNYECKVMVILISSAKNGRNKTENVSTVFLSLAPRVHYSECSLIHTLSAPITRKIIEIQYICRPGCEEFISQPRFIAMRLSPQDLVRDRSSRCNHDRARQSPEICITIKSRFLMDAITICVNANFQKGTPLCS